MVPNGFLRQIGPFTYLGHVVSAEVVTHSDPIWIVTIDGLQRGAFPWGSEKDDQREQLIARLKDFTERHRTRIEGATGT